MICSWKLLHVFVKIKTHISVINVGIQSFKLITGLNCNYQFLIQKMLNYEIFLIFQKYNFFYKNKIYILNDTKHQVGVIKKILLIKCIKNMCKSVWYKWHSNHIERIPLLRNDDVVYFSHFCKNQKLLFELGRNCSFWFDYFTTHLCDDEWFCTLLRRTNLEYLTNLL